MASFTRESKLRQSSVTVSKRDQHYESLKTYQLQNDVNGITGNSTFLAYADSAGTGSAIAVLPHTSTGKNHVPVSSPAYAQPLIRAHGQAVQDFEFNPFNQQQLYSCSTDKTVKLWQIPEEGMIVDISSPVATMALADQAAVRGLASHPTVNGIVAGRGSRSLSLLDFNTNKALTSSGAKSATIPTADFASLAWSFHGDLLLTTAKDKLLRVFDPRLLGSESENVASVTAHVGLRFSRCIWLGDSPYLLTCGHNNGQEREFMLWDSRNLSGACLKRERVDSSYGPLIPLYDADLNALVLMGKGDNSLRLYDLDFAKTGDSAAIHAISNNNVTTGGADVTKGACLLPKQANDLMVCEVMRILKVSDNIVQPISVTVPRKERMKFHEDLFPATVSGAPASMTAGEYLAGESRPLTRIALVPKAGSAVAFASASPCPSPVPGDGDAGDSTRSASPAPSDTARALSKRFSSLTSGSKFRHMYGTENTKDNSFFNLAPDLSAMDSPIVACSETAFAIPHRGGGKSTSPPRLLLVLLLSTLASSGC
jgi:coronin-1B/1C/6